MLLEEEIFVTDLKGCVRLVHENICDERFGKVIPWKYRRKCQERALAGESGNLSVLRYLCGHGKSLLGGFVYSFVKCGVPDEIFEG